MHYVNGFIRSGFLTLCIALGAFDNSPVLASEASGGVFSSVSTKLNSLGLAQLIGQAAPKMKPIKLKSVPEPSFEAVDNAWIIMVGGNRFNVYGNTEAKEFVNSKVKRIVLFSKEGDMFYSPKWDEGEFELLGNEKAKFRFQMNGQDIQILEDGAIDTKSLDPVTVAYNGLTFSLMGAGEKAIASVPMMPNFKLPGALDVSYSVGQGRKGKSGADGRKGSNGSRGCSGSSSSRTQGSGGDACDGRDGDKGRDGESGGEGGAGPQGKKAVFYVKQLKANVTGQDLVLFYDGNKGKTLVLEASQKINVSVKGGIGGDGGNGGDGGTGGDGGDGGRGGKGGSGYAGSPGRNGSHCGGGYCNCYGEMGKQGGPGGPGGDGGDGGDGGKGGTGGTAGKGGVGGKGGDICVVIDGSRSFQNAIMKSFTVDVSGGPGGSPGKLGSGGRGGDRGDGGSAGSGGNGGNGGPGGYAGSNNINGMVLSCTGGMRGMLGRSGSNGRSGRDGSKGRTGSSGKNGSRGSNGPDGALKVISKSLSEPSQVLTACR